MQNQESNYAFYLSTDLSDYIGQWVAIYDSHIVAHGKDVRIVAKDAQKICGNRKFLLSKIPSKETIIF